MKTLIHLTAVLFFATIAAAESYCLGRFDLAGLPPDTLPASGEILILESVEQPLRTSDGAEAGYIPAVFRGPITAMAGRGVHLRVEVVHRYANPEPGKFLAVELWAETGNPEQLVPLIYKVESFDPRYADNQR